jgi:putative sporulation protein YyaC
MIKDYLKITPDQVHKIDSNHNLALPTFVYYFDRLVRDRLYAQNNIVILCIGTDRSTGDSLGPLVGTLLKEKNIIGPKVFGTLDEPVHANNLNKTLQDIKNNVKTPFIIAIDACLGKLDHVGYINFGPGPLKPGAGVNKSLPEVGDVYLTGIVNVGGFMEFFVLQNTRLSIVMKMANVISQGIYHIFKNTTTSEYFYTNIDKSRKITE